MGERINYHQRIFKVGLNGKYGLMNKAEKAFTGLKYDIVSCHYAADYRIADVWLNYKHGFVDVHCNEIVPFKYDCIDSFENGFARVSIDDKYGFIYLNGDEVIPPRYDDAQTHFSDEFIWVQINGKYGFINTTGDIVIPLLFDGAKPFSDGMAAVKTGNKWGYINKAGVEVIPPLYEHAMRFANGKALVCEGEKVVQIDKKGEELQRLYNFVRFVFCESEILVTHKGKQGIIDDRGNIIIVPQYDEIKNPGFGSYYTAILDGKYLFINRFIK